MSKPDFKSSQALPLFNVSNLPDITFYTDRESNTLSLSNEGGRIAALSEILMKSFQPGDRVGILFRTSPDLVLWWLGALNAGLEPLVLQYPTKKLSREYWKDTLLHTVSNLTLVGLIAAPNIVLPDEVTKIAIQQTADVCPSQATASTITGVGLLQMSSGTTGFRKGIRFSTEALCAHIESYNRILELEREDKIVSWLPLYHDMGFIAAFVMPLALGIPIVMMDPITWIERRSLLYKAIHETKSTICFMPNFGFEVMSHEPCAPEDLDSIRKWISCSEPTYLRTMQRFANATGTPHEKLSVCYAAAENIFAISQSQALRTVQHDGQEVMSCGRPLPGVSVKLVDGEIYVRSPFSIQSYIGGDYIADKSGYYPTGDMGFIDKEEIFVSGRRQDILLQAGRKFFMTDFDDKVNSVLPECRGRAASIAIRDDRLGTEKLVILIETEDFINQEYRKCLQGKLLQAFAVEEFEVHLVPPVFITKTSSGKINRKKTAGDFELMTTWRANRQITLDVPFDQQIATYFPFIDKNDPICEVLDSLGHVMLSLLAEEQGVSFNLDMSLAEIIAQSKAAAVDADSNNSALPVIRIISMMDAGYFHFTTDDLERLSKTLGIPVEFEHVCLPPAAVLVDELIFRDYFLCRNYSDEFAAYTRILDKLNNASILLTDDGIELDLCNCAFPVMSWKFERAPVASLLGVRHQRFTANHHKLPVAAIRHSNTIPSAARDQAYAWLSRYLGIPLFKFAHIQKYADQTEGWEHRDFSEPELQKSTLVDRLEGFLKEHIEQIPKPMGQGRSAPVYDDMNHFCSFMINPALIEWLLKKFTKFIWQGLPNSIPYIFQRFEEEKTEYVIIPTMLPGGSLGEWEEKMPDACVIQAGAWLPVNTKLPVVRLIHGMEEHFKNLPDGIELPLGLSSTMEKSTIISLCYIHDETLLHRFNNLDAQSFDFVAKNWRNLPPKEPILLGTIESENYNLVAYDGWVYGLPRELGPIDLPQTDVIAMAGVIRDVSRDVVESEVISRSKEKRLET